jgi:hypothetical protein
MRHHLLRRVAVLVLPLAVLAACGDDSNDSEASPTSTEAPATEALRYVANGGCQMMGPNCATYVVYTDGKVEIFRTGENTPAEVTGAIPAGEIEAYLESVADVDVAALTDEVGPGTCNACVDGIDVVLTLALGDEEVVLDSTIVNFDPEHPFFENLDLLMADVFAIGELPIQQRP